MQSFAGVCEICFHLSTLMYCYMVADCDRCLLLADPPSNYGCVDYYTFDVQPVNQVLTSSFFDSIRIQSSKCYEVKNLSRNTKYKATVGSYNKRFDGGGSSSIVFTTQ